MKCQALSILFFSMKKRMKKAAILQDDHFYSKSKWTRVQTFPKLYLLCAIIIISSGNGALGQLGPVCKLPLIYKQML